MVFHTLAITLTANALVYTLGVIFFVVVARQLSDQFAVTVVLTKIFLSWLLIGLTSLLGALAVARRIATHRSPYVFAFITINALVTNTLGNVLLIGLLLYTLFPGGHIT